MPNKYEHSFDCDDLPQECPLCGHKFNYIEDVSIDPYKDGYRSMLTCPKSHFKKVLSYIKECDIDQEEDMEDAE